MERIMGIGEKDISAQLEERNDKVLNQDPASDPNYVRGLISWAERATLSLKGNFKDAIKKIRDRSVVVFGERFDTGEPYVGVVAPLVQTESPEKLAEVKKMLTGRGIAAIHTLEAEGKLSNSEAQKLRMEMSLGGVGINLRVQNKDNLFKGQTRQNRSEVSNLGTSTSRTTNVSEVSVQKAPKLTRREFFKKGLVLAGSVTLAGCSVVPVAPAVVNPDVGFGKETKVPTMASVRTQESTNTPEPPKEPTPKPTVRIMEASGGTYNEKEIACINSESIEIQKQQLTRYVETSSGRKNSPFDPNTDELRWKYFFDDDSGNATECRVVFETSGGGYGAGRIFTLPIVNGQFVYDLSFIKGDYNPEGYGPLELTAGKEGQKISVKDGNFVRRLQGNNEVVERINMQTAQWEALSQAERVLQRTETQFKDLGVDLDSGEYTTTQDENGVVTVVDNKRKVEIYRNEKFFYNYIFNVAKNKCEITDIENKTGSVLPTKQSMTKALYYLKSLTSNLIGTKNGNRLLYPIFGTEYCWVVADNNYFIFRDKEGVRHQVPIIDGAKYKGQQGSWK